MPAPTDDPLVIATSDITLPSGSDNKKIPDPAILTDGYGVEALPLNDYNYTINNHGEWLTYIKDEVIPSIDVTNWNATSQELATAAGISWSGDNPTVAQNFQAIVEQCAGRAQKTINNGTSGVTVKVQTPILQESPQSYYDGMTLIVDIGGSFDGGTNCTLELDSLGAKKLLPFDCGLLSTVIANLPVDKNYFNKPTEVYYRSGTDSFYVKSDLQEQTQFYNNAIDIVTVNSTGSQSLGLQDTITLSYLTGGTFNYGKLLHGSIDYSSLYNVGDIITISGLGTWTGASPPPTYTLDGTYEIQSFSDGGNGMLLQDVGGGNVEDVAADWTSLPSSPDNINRTSDTTGQIVLTGQTLPYSLNWTDFERIEVLTRGEDLAYMTSMLGVVPREIIKDYPSSFQSKVWTTSGNSAGITSTGLNTFDINQDGDWVVYVKGYLRRGWTT